MGKVINKGYTDTPIENVGDLSVQRKPINFGADFRVLSDTSNEVVLTNVTSPIDRPERIRIARKEVNNVYQGTDISSSVFAPSKRGVNLHLQLQQTVEVTDDANPEFLVQAPITTSITIKTPASYLDAGNVLDSVERLLSALYDTNSNESDRMAGLLRGSLVPKDI